MATSPTAEREKRTAVPKDFPTRSPYEGSIASQAIERMSQATMPRAPDGSMAGPGLTPYAPYRMGPNPEQLAAAPVPPAAQPVPNKPIPAAGNAAMTLARAPDGSLAGPGVTPYAPYRMGPTRQPVGGQAAPAAPVAVAPTAPAAPRAPIPSVGTMPMEPDVEGPSRNPLAGAAAALSSSVANAFPAARAAMADYNTATLDAAAKGNMGAAVGQAMRGAVVTPFMAAGDVLGGIAGTVASAAKPAMQTAYTALTGDSSPIGQGGSDPRSAQGDTAKTKNPAADQGAGKPPAEAAAAANKPQAAPGTPSAAATMAAPATPTAPAAPGAPSSTGQVNVRRQPNGVMEFSGTNVAGPVSYNGADAAGFRPSGAGVSVVPGMRPGEARAILARPFDPAGGLDGGQRAVYDAQVAQAQAINAADAARGTGRIGDYIRSGQARRALVNQNLQGANDERQQQMASRTAADVLAERRQNESEANSSVTRRTNEVTAQGAEQIQELRNRVLNAATPEERDTAAKQLQAISGKEQENRYTRVSAGSQIDPTTGAVIQLPDVLVDNRTGRPVNLSGAAPGQGQGAAAPVTPPADAITFLRDKGRSDPAVAAAFDEKYGPGAAARYLR